MRHEAAGDLLRRIGDDAGARTAYLFAANRASEATPPDWFEAGRILSHKAGLLDLAVDAFRCGWLQRPAANATACALELIAIHAPHGEISPLRDLLDEADALAAAPPEDLLTLDENLERLTSHDPKAAQLVKLHCFAGLTVEQAAEALAISRTNGYRLWTFARAWLYSQLAGDREADS